jgi:steroid 5-alpha reductase family enzyme
MNRAFAAVGIAYALAGAVALAIGFVSGDAHPIRVALAADVGATLAIFAFSLAFRNSSFYDAYWSVAPIAIALYWALSADAGNPARQLLVVGLVTAWGVRLTWNWARGWRGLDHEDWRYLRIRERTGRGYWPASFISLHMIPTLIVFAGCLPLHPALASSAPLGLLDGLAVLVTAAAIACEATADQQLRRFLTAPGRRPGDLLASGLWSWSRHPNYFGEMLFWWGIFLFAVAVGALHGWTILGALTITAMLRFISLPLIEERMLERRPEFAARLATTSMLVPWPRRRG